MVRQASLEAYSNSEFSGVNQFNCLRILRYLKLYPWSTRHDIAADTGIEMTSVSGRVTDLKNKGLIFEGMRVKTEYSKVKCGTLAIKSDYENMYGSQLIK